MKTLLDFKSRLLAAFVALVCCASMSAADYTALQMGEVFSVKNGGNDIWTITPSESGLMKIVGDNGDGDWIGSCLVVYGDESMTAEIQSYNWTCYEVKVEAGQTYYIKTWNFSGQDFKAHCSMSDMFAFKSVAPEEGGLFAITSETTAYLHFTSSQVTFSEGEITVNGNVVKIYNFTDYNELVKNGTFTYTQEGMSGVVDWNGNICGRMDNDGIAISFTTQTGHGYYNVIKRLLDKGKIAAGDQMALTLHGVKNSMTDELLNGDGELEVNWVFAGAPTELVSHNVPATILSWYNPGDPEGLATFTFSRDIKSARASLEMGQGEGADDLYYEEIPADHIKCEGNTVTVDFSGVMRTKSTMNLKMNWNQFYLTLMQVVDIDGNDTYSEDQGSASSYHFTTGYKDVSGTLSYEITPKSGATLTDKNKSVEIWFNNSDLIDYDGVSIMYYTEETVVETVTEVIDGEEVTREVETLQNVAHETLVLKDQLDITVDDEGTVIVCALPEGISDAKNVSVRLNITKTLDGNRHDVVAYYNTSLSYDLDLQRVAEPVNESTVHRLSEIYLTIGSTYAINAKLKQPVEVVGKTTGYNGHGTIVSDGMTNAKIVLDEPITAADTYDVTIAKGAVGDYIYGESGFNSGITNDETRLTYVVTGLYEGRDVIATPDNGETVASLAEIKLQFFNYSNVAPTWNVEKAAYVEEIVSENETITHDGVFVEKAGTNNELVFALDKPITTSGHYRFVLTAGSVANAATGDPIATEYVFEYTVDAAVVPSTRPTLDPEEGTLDEIANILIDFGQPVTVVEPSEENDNWVPQPVLMSTDDGWTLFASGQLYATENPNVLVWMQEGTAVKGCDVEFSIPAGCVMFADGTLNPDYKYNYTITGANCVEINVVSTTPEQWSYVDELSEMTITFDQPVVVGDWPSVSACDAFWTKFANGTLTATDDPCTVKIVFDEPITEFGDASITISAYSLSTAEGKPYDQDIYLNITIGENGGQGGNNDPVEDENIEITPAAFSTLASLKYFEITFGGYAGAWNEEPITLLDQFDNVVATVNPYSMSGNDAAGNSFWEQGKTNTYSITLPKEITEPGYYCLYIPAVCEKPDGYTVNREFYFTFEVVADDDPTAFAAAAIGTGRADIYSVSGQLVKKSATAADAKALNSGIYIINGKKVAVRK